MIDSKMLSPPPRTVRLARSYLGARNGWAVAAVVAGFILALFVTRAASERRSLAEHGENVVGKVVDRRIVSGKSSSNHVNVTFDTPRGAFNQDFTVTDATYESSEVGNPFPVFYDATNPSNARLEPVTRQDASEYALKWWLAWVAGGVVVSLTFYAVADRAKLQAKRLAEWPLSELRVSTVKVADSKSPNLIVSGKYLDEKGKWVEATGVAVAKSVHVESPIPILYNPTSDTVVALESLGYVEPA